jgi:hypothetical protein
MVQKDGQVIEWSGQDVPGNAVVVDHSYGKAGKWSNNRWTIQADNRVVFMSLYRDWETGFSFPCYTIPDLRKWLSKEAAHANWESFVQVVEQWAARSERVRKDWEQVLEKTKRLELLEQQVVMESLEKIGEDLLHELFCWLSEKHPDVLREFQNSRQG